MVESIVALGILAGVTTLNIVADVFVHTWPVIFEFDSVVCTVLSLVATP